MSGAPPPHAVFPWVHAPVAKPVDWTQPNMLVPKPLQIPAELPTLGNTCLSKTALEHVVLTRREMAMPRDGCDSYRWSVYVASDEELRRYMWGLLIPELAIRMLHFICGITRGAVSANPFRRP